MGPSGQTRFYKLESSTFQLLPGASVELIAVTDKLAMFFMISVEQELLFGVLSDKALETFQRIDSRVFSISAHAALSAVKSATNQVHIATVQDNGDLYVLRIIDEKSQWKFVEKNFLCKAGSKAYFSEERDRWMVNPFSDLQITVKDTRVSVLAAAMNANNGAGLVRFMPNERPEILLCVKDCGLQ